MTPAALEVHNVRWVSLIWGLKLNPQGVRDCFLRGHRATFLASRAPCFASAARCAKSVAISRSVTAPSAPSPPRRLLNNPGFLVRHPPGGSPVIARVPPFHAQAPQPIIQNLTKPLFNEACEIVVSRMAASIV